MDDPIKDVSEFMRQFYLGVNLRAKFIAEGGFNNIEGSVSSL